MTKLRAYHHWKRYEGMFVLTVLAFASGHAVVTITVLNFTLEIEL